LILFDGAARAPSLPLLLLRGSLLWFSIGWCCQGSISPCFSCWALVCCWSGLFGIDGASRAPSLPAVIAGFLIVSYPLSLADLRGICMQSHSYSRGDAGILGISILFHSSSWCEDVTLTWLCEVFCCSNASLKKRLLVLHRLHTGCSMWPCCPLPSLAMGCLTHIEMLKLE